MTTNQFTGLNLGRTVGEQCLTLCAMADMYQRQAEDCLVESRRLLRESQKPRIFDAAEKPELFDAVPAADDGDDVKSWANITGRVPGDE